MRVSVFTMAVVIGAALSVGACAGGLTKIESAGKEAEGEVKKSPEAQKGLKAAETKVEGKVDPAAAKKAGASAVPGKDGGA